MDNQFTLEEIAPRVRMIVAEILGDVDPDGIGDDEPLFDGESSTLPIDSLDLIKLELTITDQFNLSPDIDFYEAKLTTVNDIAEYVFSLLKEAV